MLSLGEAVSISLLPEINLTWLATGVEFAAELFDLCSEDLKKLFPTLAPYIKISIYDVAPKILPMFDSKLADYAVDRFKRDGIDVKTKHNILELRRGLPEGQDTVGASQCFTLKTKQEGEIGIGMCVWSTGSSPPLSRVKS